MQVFCRKGYKAASLRDLLEAMGIGKGSFYAVFGSKQALFVRVLQLYCKEHSLMSRMADVLADGPAKEAIGQVLKAVLDRSLEDGDCCLFAKAALEFRQDGQEVADEVGSGVRRVERAFCLALLKGQENGEISPQKNAQELGCFFVSVFYGLQVMANAAADRSSLEAVVAHALRVLD